jgi:GT2 family glycosyltransferase
MIDREMDPKVSVCIVNWNARDSLLACLGSLRAHPPSMAWECVVVDNASADGSVEAVTVAAPWARVIANPTNVGLPVANNQAVRATTGEYIVLSNPDVIYRPGALDALLDLMVRRPRAAFGVPRLLHPDGTLQTSVGSLPTLSEALRGRAASQSRSHGTSGFWWDGWPHDEECAVGHGAESCYAVRRSATDDFGLQDESFALDWEGIEWSARAGQAGWEIWFSPAAEVVHTGGVSIKQAQARWIVQSHRGLYRYFAPRSHPLARPLVALAVAARGGMKLLATALGQGFYDRAHRGRLRA